jgi:hypothetical protein
MGKNAKEHRKKVAKRNQKISESKKVQEKYAMDFLMRMIQKEKEKGLFNNPVQPLPQEPSVDTTTNYSGPQI